MRPTPRQAEFKAMGSTAHLVVVGGPAQLVDRGRARVADLERRWSRFLPDSEVSELTRRAGTPVSVSPETALLVELAVEAFRLSGGSFDPTVLGDVVRAGYDRSFDARLGASAGLSPEPEVEMPVERDELGHHHLRRLVTGCSDIEIDGAAVCLPEGTGFDPGGIGKGLAADLVTEELLEAGAEGACLSLGGDVRVRGVGPDDEPWTVAVEHPWAAEPIARIGLLDGAVATSTSLKRRWAVAGEMRHHLIDPGTGRPSDSDLTLVSAVAGNGWVAEILAKSVLLRGSVHPFDLIGGMEVEALAVDVTGRIQASTGLRQFLGGMPLAPHLAALDHPSVRAACSWRDLAEPTLRSAS